MKLKHKPLANMLTSTNSKKDAVLVGVGSSGEAAT